MATQGTVIPIEREHYRLSDAAATLNLTEDDLLHLGATGRADLSAPVLNEGLYSWGKFSPQLVQRPDLEAVALWFSPSDRVVLHKEDVARLESTGGVRITSFVMPLGPLPDYAGEWFSYDQVTPEIYAQMAFTEKKHLFVSSAEMKRLRNEALARSLDTLGEGERATLQRQIAALALVLAEKFSNYKRGDKPNGSKIAEEVEDLLSCLEDANTHGVSKSNLRANIRAGINLLRR
ncbi:hypothetical protein [Pandoraea bronchicola]|uniref:hypothetical protein n=1 Tax=Pandoraea bronchicola TaxID=2508287 RepID=UPI001241C62C|nr:hypothetical protein [Pandoraea bronchicola]